MRTELTGGYILKHKHYSEVYIISLIQAILIATILRTPETLMLDKLSLDVFF
jgi:hypothetical protein